MIILLLLGKIAFGKKKLCKLTKIVKICTNIFFKFFVAIFGSNSAVFIKSIHAILPKSRRMIIDYQLNSLLENCLKTQLVGFGWADVLDLNIRIQFNRKTS